MKWSHLPLEQFVDFYNGKSIKPSEKGNFPAFGSNGIIGYSENYLYDKGIIIGRVGANCGSVEISLSNFWPSDNTIVAKPKTNADLVFVYYLLKNYPLNSYAGGSAQPLLTQTVLKPIKFKIPEYPTQCRIASILSAYDDLIENNLKRIKLLEEKAELMFRIMHEELKDSSKNNLYDFADIQMGFAFKAEAFNETREGTPIIRIRDIPNQITKSYTTQEVESNYFVEKGDLLIGMDGEFHMNEWLGQRGYLVQRVCRLRAKNPLFQSYLWQALKEPVHYFETTISGATVAHLGKKHLEEIFIAEPKDSMKREIEELNTMRKLKIVLADQNTKLREARDILLPKLMSGQIAV